MSIHSFKFNSNQPDETEELLFDVSPGVKLRKHGSGDFRALVTGHALPMLGLFAIHLDHGNVTAPGGLPYFSLTLPRTSSVEVVDRSQSTTYTPSEMHILAPGEPFDLRASRGGRTLVANIDAILVKRHLSEENQKGSSVRTLPTTIPLERGRGTSLLSYLEFLHRECQCADSSFRTPVVANEAAMVVAALLGEVIEHSPQASHRKECGTTEESPRRRAEEYIAAHVASAVALPDIAEAAGVSPRTLSRVFRSAHGMGPIQFLAERRFEAARSTLLASSPECTSVTMISLRYGFASPGRFAVQYRRRFGEKPSETLARNGHGGLTSYLQAESLG